MATPDRVTNAQLRDAISDSKDVIRAEQKTEHFKTRILVLCTAGLTTGMKIVTALGFVRVPHI